MFLVVIIIWAIYKPHQTVPHLNVHQKAEQENGQHTEDDVLGKLDMLQSFVQHVLDHLVVSPTSFELAHATN